MTHYKTKDAQNYVDNWDSSSGRYLGGTKDNWTSLGTSESPSSYPTTTSDTYLYVGRTYKARYGDSSATSNFGSPSVYASNKVTVSNIASKSSSNLSYEFTFTPNQTGTGNGCAYVDVHDHDWKDKFWFPVKASTLYFLVDGTTQSTTRSITSLSSNYTLLSKSDESTRTFKGWYTASTGGTRIGGSGSSISGSTLANYIEDNGRVILYAQWESVSYTVTYNANSGSVSPSSSTVTAGNSVTLPTPTRSGYTFQGWYSGTTFIGWGGGSYTPTASITLTAKWGYKVTYNANSGTVSPTSETVDPGTSVTLPYPTRYGYQFDGWYSGSTRVGGGGSSYTPSTNITLTAQWTWATATITYYENGTQTQYQSAAGTSTSSRASFTAPGNSITSPVIDGVTYEFKGWSTTNYTVGQGTPTYYQGNTIYVYYGSSLTLYAVYAAVQVTYYSRLRYNAKGGSGGPSDDHTSTTTTTQPSARTAFVSSVTPSLSGYTFLGWSDTEYSVGSGTATYTSGSQVSVPYSTSDNPTKTIYAVYSVAYNQYTARLKFNSNGGNDDAPADMTDTQSAQYPTGSKTFTIPSGQPTYVGHTFQGWRDNNTGTVYHAGDSYAVPYDSTKTLYAVWEEITPTPPPSQTWKKWTGRIGERFTYSDWIRITTQANQLATCISVTTVTFETPTRASVFSYVEANKLEQLTRTIASISGPTGQSYQTNWTVGSSVTYIDFERIEANLYAIYVQFGGSNSRIDA